MDNSIWVESMVASQTGEPMVVLRWYDHSAQLTPHEAREHALSILAAADAAESDATLVVFARKAGMDKQKQAAFVQAYRTHRQEQQEQGR